MPYNGVGIFQRAIASWVGDKNNGIDITASRFDSEDNDFASGLSNCLTKDGQQIPTARIKFNVGIGVNVGSASTPSISVIGDTGTGFFQPTSGQVSFAAVGSQIVDFTSAGIVLHGSASGTATLGVKSTAGTVNFTLPVTNGTNGQLMQTDGAGNTSWVNVTSGSGTVNSGTSGQLSYYASSTNAVSGNANANIANGALTLGVASSVLGSLVLSGSTSGTTTINPNVTASGTLTLPAATDTLIGKATTDTLTNKTYDTAGTGNTFKINGTSITAISGNTAKVATTTGSLTSGHLASFDASGNIQDSGSSVPLITPLGVGSIILAKGQVSTAYASGATETGSNLICVLFPGDTTSADHGIATTDSPTGTWKTLMQIPTSNPGLVSLWQRIS